MFDPNDKLVKEALKMSDQIVNTAEWEEKLKEYAKVDAEKTKLLSSGGMIHGQGEKEQTAEGGIQMKCGDRVVRDATSAYGKLSGVVHNVHFPAPGEDMMFELVTDQGQHYIFPKKELRMEVLGDVFPPGSPPNKRLEKNLKEGMIHGQGEKVTTEHGAVREANTGRGRFDLLPYEALEAYAIWSELGADKYGDRNWERGLSVKDCINRLVRHAVKAGNGWTDEDHLAACIWNAAAAITMMKRRPDCNDHPWQGDDFESFEHYRDCDLKTYQPDDWKKAIPVL